MEKEAPASSLTSVIDQSINQSPTISVLPLLSQVYPLPTTPLGHSLRQGLDRTYPNQTFSLESG